MSTFFYVISFCSILGTISLGPFACGALCLCVLTQPHRDGWQLLFSAPYVRGAKKIQDVLPWFQELRPLQARMLAA